MAEKRSSMFFTSDVMAAADTAAFELESHGLTPEQVQELSQELSDFIFDWFRIVREEEAKSVAS